MSENEKVILEIQENKLENEKVEQEIRKPLFTRSRILFLISVFFVFLMPLAYRYLTKFM